MSRNPTFLVCFLLAPLSVRADGPAYRLRSDQAPVPAYVPGDARMLTAVGDRLFFVGTDPVNGTEVWTSDGTAAGTHLVRDIYPGPDILSGGGVPENDLRENPTPGPLVTLGDVLLFTAYDGSSPYETPRCVLWRSDGSTAGTFPVIDPARADAPVLPCISLAMGAGPPAMPVSGGRMFFGAYQGSSGTFGLWSTDGTEAGTRYLAPFTYRWVLWYATDVSGILAFQGYDSVHGIGLWRSDGTPEGTRFVVPLGGGVGKLAAFGHSVAVEEYVPVGSAGQLSLVDLDSGRSTLLRSFSFATITAIASVRGKLVFSVSSGGAFMGGDDGVWASDGTPGGTTRIAALAGVWGLAAAGDILVCASATGLFRTDGTAGGTSGLKTLAFMLSLTSVGSRVWFTASDTNGVRGVWQSDGTPAGTSLVTSATIGSRFVAVGERVFFAGASGDSGGAAQPAGAGAIVWSSDGTAQGTGPLGAGSGPALAAAGLTLLGTSGRGAFFASVFPPGAGGNADLWFSDGRPGGAVRLLSVPHGTIKGAAVFRGKLVFVVEDFTMTWLWESDGTSGGTAVLASQALPYGLGTRITDLASTGDAVIFIQVSAYGVAEIWRTDGSTAGTTIAGLPIPRGSIWTLDRAGDRLVFDFYFSTGGIQLFSTDGTLSGTVPFASVGSYSSPVTSGNTLFFIGTGSAPSTEALWKTDGTGPGTSSLMDAPSIDSLVAGPRGSVYFLAPGMSGPRLWKSDGTAAGTVSLVDLPQGTRLLPSSGPVVFFTARDPSTGEELWRTDGTTGGTRVVRDVVPGGLGSDPSSVVSLGHVLLFAASDGEHGNELWRTDGSAEGTRMIEDILPGPGSSSPGEFLEACGGLVYFTAEVDGVGRDPFAVPLSAIDPSARPIPCPVAFSPGRPVRARPVRP